LKNLLIGSLALCLFSAPAFADCAGSRAVDRCLIGTWHFQSGGSADWMARNIHQAHVTGISHNDLVITFRPDGTFETRPVNITADVASDRGDAHGTGHTRGQARGTWTAAGGRFTLCTDPSSIRTTVSVVVHGRTITVPASDTAARPHATAYTCGGAAMVTTQPIPGHEPIVTRYVRGR
jgi:hypothetical protein